MDAVTQIQALFAGDDELLEATDWHVFRMRQTILHEEGEGSLMQALEFVHERFEDDVILDPERDPCGPRGRQGRPPSAAVVRAYAARFARIADLLEAQEAAIRGGANWAI